MFGGDYIVQTGQETYKAATQGIYALVCRNLLETESEEFARELAAAVALFIWDDPPTDKGHIAFRREHQKRIEGEIWKPYLRTPAMQELLSGAAYNIGYSRYVAAGGGRLLNRYLGYLRSDNLRSKNASDWKAHTALYAKLAELSLGILRPIESLKRWSLWKPRPDNPNEQQYYQAICAFARQSAPTFDVVRTDPTFHVEQVAPSAERNPALDELKRLPQAAITAGLIAAIPGLASELYVEAKKQASSLGIHDANFVECVFDLELVGAFEKVMTFTDDRNLVSLFVDAMVFHATGKTPSTPSHVEISSGETSGHRGIAKYALATKHSSSGVPDPGAWLFTKEFTGARGDGDIANPSQIVVGGRSVLTIRRTGVWLTERALTGKSPTQVELDALPNQESLSESLEPGARNAHGKQNPLPAPGIDLPTKEQVTESWEAYKKGPDAMLEWVKKNRAEYEAKGDPDKKN
jgi:hypothetical protein